MSSNTALRLAMWSGPRNISTAMMRSWGNRGDTIVRDEPLYAHYLAVTGFGHPGADEVIAAGPTNLQIAIDGLLEPLPAGKSIFYQKHMAHHLLSDIDRDWIRRLSNCFLIRDPKHVIVSYIKHVPNPTLEDTGFAQQAELFNLVRKWTGRTPPVIDARDILENPRGMLERLCDALDVSFQPEMLSWAAGLRESDGVWAKYWYKEVETTTSFRPYQPKNEPVPGELADVLAAAQGFYEEMYQHRLRA